MNENVGWNFEHTYSELPECFFSPSNPTPVKDPRIVVFNDSLALEMGLNAEALKQPGSVAHLAGNDLPATAKPIAQAYAGHQFANFTMLGDGRAILLGEQITPQGQRFDVQLKGAGRTTYSRNGDGRAALGPMLREFVMSEAMHALGIPTTRSLAVIATGEEVVRERIQPGAILTRVATSHIRVGTFEFAAIRDDIESLAILTLYALERHFPGFREDIPPAYTLLKNVIEAQAQLVANWMSVGFIHGVMNTDNMTISGETIDYGPCAIMDHYHPNTVFSAIDQQGRYCFANQAQMALWNLERFAETLLPLLHEDSATGIEMAQDALDIFANVFNSSWLTKMGRKLGLEQAQESDQVLIKDLLGIMQKHEWDFNNTFRALISFVDSQEHSAVQKSFASLQSELPIGNFEPKLKYGCENAAEFSNLDFQKWLRRWRERLIQQALSLQETRELMKQTNPTVVARNHQVNSALWAAERGDISHLNALLAVLRDPFSESANHLVFSTPPAKTERVLKTFCGT